MTSTPTGTGHVALDLTADELHLVMNALQSYLSVFGHEEADVLHAAQRLLARLREIELG